MSDLDAIRTDVLGTKSSITAPVEGAQAMVVQLAQQLKTAELLNEEEHPARYVTAWISGEEQFIQFARSYGSLVKAVGRVFEMDKTLLRIFVLRIQNKFSQRDIIRLSECNFEDFISERGTFENTSKLYACDDTSSDGSFESTGVGEESQSSITSNESEEDEFSNAVRRRDQNKCVYCNAENQPLVAARIIPVEQKYHLYEPRNCLKYGIGSINDTSNGISLCWDCHRCFTANLLCLDPITGKLLITEDLFECMPVKWGSLLDNAAPIINFPWPSKALLKFREDAMHAATVTRHERNEKQSSEYKLFCLLCSNSYVEKAELAQHEMCCEGKRCQGIE
jgi:HNH endonuclease